MPRWQRGPWVRMVLEQPVNDSHQAPSSINLRLHGTASKALPISDNNVGPYLIFDWPGPTTLQHKANTTRHLTGIVTPIPRTTPKFHVSKGSVLDLKVTIKLLPLVARSLATSFNSLNTCRVQLRCWALGSAQRLSSQDNIVIMHSETLAL